MLRRVAEQSADVPSERLAVADADNRRALLALGLLDGLGMPQDYVLAHMWLTASRGRGREDVGRAGVTPRKTDAAQERGRS